jgi:hypothetical protein
MLGIKKFFSPHRYAKQEAGEHNTVHEQPRAGGRGGVARRLEVHQHPNDRDADHSMIASTTMDSRSKEANLMPILEQVSKSGI